MVKNLPVSAGGIRDGASFPGLERSPGGGHGNPIQYSCLENPMDRGAWAPSPWGHKELDPTEVTECAACILITMYTNKVGKIFQFT